MRFLFLGLQSLHGFDAGHLLGQFGLELFALFFATLLDDITEQILLHLKLVHLILSQLADATVLGRGIR